MKISIIHPSRSRPQQAAATAKAWRDYKRSLLMYNLAKDKNSTANKALALRLNKMYTKLTGLPNNIS